MGDPGSDYDQYENRLNTVEHLLNIAARHGVYPKMINWRNMFVFDDDDEVKAPVKRTDSGVDMREGSKSLKDSERSEDIEKAKVNKEKSVWDDTNGVWRDADNVKGKNDFNEYGLWYGKPWVLNQ